MGEPPDAGLPMPLILTLALDPQAQERFDRLRREHFPPERNHLGAHVTLFNHLPGAQDTAIRAELRRVAATCAPADVAVTGVRSLGRGVAFALRSAEVDAVRARLAAAWSPWLTPQDRGRRALHVTVSNKVSPDRARALDARLSAGFVPEVVRAPGLNLWRYLGGPWEHLASYPFTG